MTWRPARLLPALNSAESSLIPEDSEPEAWLEHDSDQIFEPEA